MNHQAPVPTIEQQRKLRELLAQDRAVRAASSMHRVVAPAAFPKMQPDDEPIQQDPCQFCAAPDQDSDAPLPKMILGVVIGLLAWWVFGWAVPTLIDVWSAK